MAHILNAIVLMAGVGALVLQTIEAFRLYSAGYTSIGLAITLILLTVGWVAMSINIGIKDWNSRWPR